MFDYRITGTKLEMKSGVIQLNAHQAALRRMNLQRIGADLYKVLKPVEFKKGERIGCDAVLKIDAVEIVEAKMTDDGRRPTDDRGPAAAGTARARTTARGG